MTSRFPSSRSGQDLSPRCKLWVKPTDQMDKWLDTQGYYRKHTARDGSCLFRAVSEQMFLTQAFHLDVRRQCLEFALRHPQYFEKALKCSVTEYAEKIRKPHEWGGKLELEAMALLYRKEFILFQEVGQPAENVTNFGFEDKLLLCFSQDRHYDSVYTKQHITNAAFCQSIVYDMMYKGVFELQEVDFAVKKMLHDKTARYQHQRESNFLASGLAIRLEMRDSCVNVKDLLTVGVTPFPYKVAKSLDPDIYRNVEYDTWNDYRRGLRFGITTWNNRELQVGVKCLVKLQPDRICHAHIQEMEPNKGPVVVFVEELGEKLTVLYDNLELLPQPTTSQILPIPVKQLRQLHGMKLSPSDDTPSSNSDIEEDEHDESQLTMIPWSSQDKSWNREDEGGRKAPKIKMFSEMQRNNKKNKCGRTKSKEGDVNKLPPNRNDSIQHHTPSPVVSSTNNMECSYHHDVMEIHDSYDSLNFQSWQSCETVSDQETVETVNQPEVPPTMLCLEPTTSYYTHIPTGQTHLGDANNNFQPASYCTMVAQKSVMPDCSDLPLTDLPTLRYFYNYGVDYMRVNRVVRPVPPCYLNTSVGYIPEHAISPVLTTPDSTVAMSPVGFYRPRPDSMVSNVGNMTMNSESEVLHNSHQMAPRFKNKARPSNIIPKQQQGVSYEGPSLVQQCEVSSSTPAPPHNHFLPSPVSPYPPAIPPPPPQPIYYLPVECEAYCPANYVEYSVYDPTPTSIYPTVYPQPAHPAYSPAGYSPTTYIPPEAIFYQHVIQPAQIPPNV